MSASEATPNKPNPVLGFALRAPVVLVDLAPWLFGHRLLVLTHRGRRSGRTYRMILEVVRWDAESSEAVVMAGFGENASWLLNVEAGGAEEIHIGRRRFRPDVGRLEVNEAARVVADYELRNRFVAPLIRALFSRLAGFRYDGSDRARRRLVEALPLVTFRPLDRSPASITAPPQAG